MPYQITYVPSAVKVIKQTDPLPRQRILKAIEALSINPRPRGCKRLKGGQGELRIRVGSHRVIYEVNDGQLTILVLKIGHRSSIYRR
ncbi:type II toxin-antitoxin system RelE family toxin [Boudabousia marimammalium]|uniref:type II toxin-antitoxin system RelE family toxin n=1 Tax=Boudabousia marimammalium TaxID=156892 RepID=UPI00094DA121